MLKLTRSPRGVITPVAGGDRAYVRLAGGVRNNYVSLVARGQFDQSVGAATSIRNRGSLWAAVDEVVLDENGTDRHLYRGNVLRMISETLAPSALSATRLTTTAIQAATQLRESARMYFAMPFSAEPGETAFVEQNPGQLFQLGIRLAPTPHLRLVNPGANTSVLSNFNVSVLQGYDPPDPRSGGLVPPLFIPQVRQQVIQVPGANSSLVDYIRTTNLVRMIVISQETTTEGEVSDIINSFAFRGDLKNIIGPTQGTFADLLLDNEYELGGAVVGNSSHLPLMFQRYGRISDSLNPAQDVNIRFEYNVQPSASAGVSQIRVTIVELVRNAVTSAQVPFNY